MRSVPVSKSFCDPSFAVVERKNVSGWEYPFGTPGSPLSSGTGSFRTICLSPCLHQRLLLWNEQGTYSVFFTDRRAGDPYGCSVAVGGVSGKKWKISYSRSGSRRPSDRRNGIGSFYISGAVSGAAAEERETK